MGWSVGYDERWHRDIGYGVPALCDHPGCYKKIDRGLSYVCGSEPYGGDDGCGLYFCNEHLSFEALSGVLMCYRCYHQLDHLNPKPDLEEWINWKMTDPSWAEWRRLVVQQNTERK